MKARIGLVQFPVAEKQPQLSFFDKIRSFVKDAESLSLDMLVFPELASLDVVDFEAPLEPQWQFLSTYFAKDYFDLFLEISKDLPFSILAGTTPVRSPLGILNQAKIFEKGTDYLTQNKLYMTPEEDLVWNWRSTSELQIFNWRGVRTAILICHDSEFPDVSLSLMESEVELLLVPSMTTDVAGLNRVRWCSMARAIEHHAYALITGTTDAYKGQGAYVGQAAFITPQNQFYPQAVQLGPYNESALVVFELDFELLRKTRAERTLVNPRRDFQIRRFKLDIKDRSK